MGMADYYAAKDADPDEWPAEDFNVMQDYLRAKDEEPFADRMALRSIEALKSKDWGTT